MATDYLHDFVLVLWKAAQVPLDITLFVMNDHHPRRIIIFLNKLPPLWHIDVRSFANGIQLFGHSYMTNCHWQNSHVEREIHSRPISKLRNNTVGEGVCVSGLPDIMKRPIMERLLQAVYRKCYYFSSLNFAHIRFLYLGLSHDSNGPVNAFQTKPVVFTWVGSPVSFRRRHQLLAMLLTYSNSH